MSFSLFDVVIFLIFIVALLPIYRRGKLEGQRLRLMRRIQQREDGRRLIVMIHRQETLSIFGIPLQRHIDIEDSEQVLRAIRMTPDDVPIDILLHTPGGLVLAAEQIALALSAHPARVRVMVPHYAMSGGTLLALAADEILLDPNAVLGPIDPQLGGYPAASILEVVRKKEVAQIDDSTLICADIARKAMIQVRHNVEKLLRRRYGKDEAIEIARALTSGQWTHDYPLHVDELQALGIALEVGLPEEIYELMDLYPQPTPRRPSVQYIAPPSGESDAGGADQDLRIKY